MQAQSTAHGICMGHFLFIKYEWYLTWFNCVNFLMHLQLKHPYPKFQTDDCVLINRYTLVYLTSEKFILQINVNCLM